MASEPDLTTRVQRLEDRFAARDGFWRRCADVAPAFGILGMTVAVFFTFGGILWVRFEAIDDRLDRIEARMDRLDDRLERIEGQLAEVLRRLPPEPR